MKLDFDQVINRRSISNINKWRFYPEDVLPLWVADMDFLTPEPVLDAVRGVLRHGILGYELPGPALLETVAAYVEKQFDWKITPEMIAPMPGVGAGMSVVVRALTAPRDGLLVQPPIFPPFIQLPEIMKRVPQQAELKRHLRHGHWHYEPDSESFKNTIDSKRAKTKLFLLCNPHNPSGRTFTREELMELAGICLRHKILICSDEIHHGIQLDGQRHIPIASLSPKTERNTITFLGPGKTYNMSGLYCVFAIIPHPGLRKKVMQEAARTVLDVNSLGLAAAGAAFSGACEEWLVALRKYLKSNRDFAVNFIETELPELRTTIPEGTYLLWIDCSKAIKSGRIKGSPHKYFLEKGKIALTGGEEFGSGGKGFVRLNFACPTSTLENGLMRMRKALA